MSGRLEEEVPSRRQVVVWREQGQTAEQAIAAWFPDGVPADVDPITVGWMERPASEN
jgi:hypothetical protein